MERGDLATSTRQRLLIVLEGVLCSVTPIIEHRRLRSDQTTGWNLLWHDTPLKRMVYLSERYPDLAMEVVTFLNQEVADLAADFMIEVPVPYSEIEYKDFKRFCGYLPYQHGIVQILDSEPARLDHYGQLGRQVVMGGDI